MADKAVRKECGCHTSDVVEIEDSVFAVEFDGVEFDRVIGKSQDREFEFLYAKSRDQRYQGLSGRESLDADGMVFEYSREERHRLVFRNMNFPLDVLFLDSDGNIVDNGSLSEENHATESVCLYAIEVEKGWIEENGISLSDSFDFESDMFAKQVPDKYVEDTGLSQDDFVPNADVNDNVEDVLDFIDVHGMPNPEDQREGAARANQIHDHYVDNEPLEYDYWKEIHDFHARHRAQGNHNCDESSIAESDKEEINQNEHDVCFFDNGYFSDYTWGSDAGLDQAERIVTAVEDAGVEKQSGRWEPYEGPRGGFGWRNVDSDEIVYQNEPPGEPDLSALSGEQISALEEALGQELTEPTNLPDTAMRSDKDDIMEGDYAYIGDQEGFLESVDRVGDDARVQFKNGAEFWVEDKEVYIDSNPEDIREDQEERRKVERVQSQIYIEELQSSDFVDTQQIENNFVRMTESVKQDVVTDNLLENLDSVDREFGSSYYRNDTSTMNVDPTATDSTLNHEMGHAIVGENGYHFPNDRANRIAKIFVEDKSVFESNPLGPSDDPFVNDTALDPSEFLGQTWGDLSEALISNRNMVPQDIPYSDEMSDEEITLDTFKLQQVDDVDTSPEMENLIEQINQAWQRQFINWGELSIGNEYSATNAHETMSRLHEHLQSPGINYEVMSDLINDFPELVEAYLDVFEPNETQKEFLSEEGYI